MLGCQDPQISTSGALQRPLFDGSGGFLIDIRGASAPSWPSTLDMIGDWLLQVLISALLPTPLLPNLFPITFLELGHIPAPSSLTNYTLLASLGVQTHFSIYVTCGSFSALTHGSFIQESFFRLASLPSLKSPHFHLKLYRANKTQSNPTPTKNFPTR
ncbi:hypothetical protein BDR03DRAFT_939243 [Suillus americanus]|nr:hypothetical protein BDR03DRAFT_939243 [Suillus americanus]